MSNSKSGLSALLKTVTGKNAGRGADLSQYLRPVLLADTSGVTSRSMNSQTGADGLKSLSVGSTPKLQSISFGKPSSAASSGSTASSGGNGWNSLLSNTLSGGGSSLLNNGISGFLGIGGLISDIAGLFGGSSKSAVQPLTLFSLSDQLQMTSYVNGTNADSLRGASASGQPSSSGIYSSSQPSGNATRRGNPVVDSTAVAQAVKSALLTSSTLADVIADI
jgi:hypothetical protein